MSDVGGVQGGQPQKPLTPEEIEHYKKDYNDGFKLFQDAYNDYKQPNLEEHKKAKLQDVMDKALNVMNETACVAISKGKQEEEAKLSDNYDAFIKSPTPENQKKLEESINQLQ